MTLLRDHVTDGTPCWCVPSVQQECPDCKGTSPACDRCHGVGWVPPYSDDEDVPTLVIHNDPDEADES